MGDARPPVPVKLVIGMLSQAPERFGRAEESLGQAYGPTDYSSPTLPFAYTDYYERELGASLLRQFVAFRDLIDPARLATIKRHTIDLERASAVDGQRTINLDPGYLCGGKLVLATTKDHAHRLYLGEGIYAEATLAWRKGAWQPWPWTYPDFRTTEYGEILTAIRALYMDQLRDLSAVSDEAIPR